jgi:hypothetical protein
MKGEGERGRRKWVDEATYLHTHRRRDTGGWQQTPLLCCRLWVTSTYSGEFPLLPMEPMPLDKGVSCDPPIHLISFSPLFFFSFFWFFFYRWVKIKLQQVNNKVKENHKELTQRPKKKKKPWSTTALHSSDSTTSVEEES